MASQKNKSLIDGLEVLSCLAGTREPVGSREMARRLGMEPTRVNRLLMTLKEIGLADQNDKRKYLPGVGIQVLAAKCLYGSTLLHNAIKTLSSVKDLTYTAALGVLWRDEVSYLIHTNLTSSIAAGIGKGPASYPALSSSIGRMLLACQGEAYIDRFFGKRNDVDPLSLKQELIKIRHVGFALVEEPRHLSIAVPLTQKGEAALSFTSVPKTAKVDTVVTRLRSLAEEMTERY